MKTNYAGHDAGYKKKLAAGARGWDTSENGYELRQEKLSNVLKKGHAPQSGNLLELGCGTGVIGLWFAGLDYKVHGIDISQTAVQHANQKATDIHANTSFHVGNVITLDIFEDNSFDFIYDSHLLHCIIDADRIEMFKNIRRVLKPNGYFLVDTMCYSEKTLNFPNFDSKTNCSITPNGIATRYIGEETSLLQELRNAHFNILDSQRIIESDGDCLMVEATI